MKNKRFSRRFFAILMAFILIIALLPAAALASDGTNSPPTVVSGQEMQAGAATPASSDGLLPAVAYTVYAGGWFTDADNDPLTYSVVSATYGTDDVSPYVSISGGTITYTPAAAQADGTVTIVVKANDGAADSTGNVTITVTVSSVPVDTGGGQPPAGEPGEGPTETEALVNIESLAVMAGEPGALSPAEAVEAGSPYTVRVTVANGGEEEAAGLGVALYEARDAEVSALVYSQSLDTLAAGAEVTLDFAWTPQTSGDYTLRAVLTAGGEETDTEELAVSVAGLFRPMVLVRAADSDFVPPIIKYKIGGTGDEITASLSEIGTWTPASTYADNKVYLVSLPYNSQISSYSIPGTGYDISSNYIYGKNTSNVSNITDFTTIPPQYYLTGTEFSGTGFINEQYKKNFLAKILDNPSATIAQIPTTADLVGYMLRIMIKSGGTGVYCPAVVVQITTLPPSASVDTTELSTLVGLVTGDNAANYYHQNDRWNGRESSSPNGFWADMQAYLTTAQGYITTPPASQQAVDLVADGLATAIGNLIPKANVNATLLHEKVVSAGTTTQTDYSTSSWSALQAQVANANAMLALLYDSNGSPTAANVAAYNGDGSIDTANSYQDEVDAQANALAAAIDGLDLKADEYQAADAKLAYESINIYANKLFNPGNMNESAFTPASWEAFTAARDTALNFYKNHSLPEIVGVNESRQYIAAFAALRNACYGLENAASPISVQVTVIDTWYLRKGTGTPQAAARQLSLPAGATLGNVISSLGVDLSATSFNSRNSVALCRLGVYINGIFYVKNENINLAGPESTNYDAVKLRDGDSVVLAIMERPAQYTLLGYASPAYLKDVGSYVKYRQTETDKTVSEAGDAISLTATVQSALPSQYLPGHTTPLSGAAVFVSDPCGTQDDARAAVPKNNTGIVTGSDGKAQLTLYAEGWYAVSIVDLSDNGGLCNGDTLIIQVTSSTKPETVKAALQVALDTVYGAYDQEYYSAADWESIKTIYASGVSGIASAATIGAAAAAQQAAINGIRAIQDATTASNTAKISAFRNALNRLPDDPGKLSSSVEHLIAGYTWTTSQGQTNHIDGLIELYGALTDYLKGQLTGIEQAKYDSVVGVYNSGLPDLDPYHLNLVERADTPAAEAAITVMTAYLREHGYIGVYNENTLDTFSTLMRRPDPSGDVTISASRETNASTSYPDRWVTLMCDPGYAAYELIDPDGISGGPHLVSGAGWSIDGSGMSHGDYTGMYYELLEDATVSIGGEPYEIKSVQFDGVDDHTQTYARMSTHFSFDNHVGTRYLYVPVALYGFAMPYNDVTVTVTWGPVAGTNGPAALEAARETARQALEDAYAGYAQADYSAANWTALTAAKDDGLSAIDAAQSSDAVADARRAALAAMALIKTLAQEAAGNPSQGGVSGTPLPDFGPVVGRVYIIVENQTFTSASSDGSLPAWYGRLVDGWYDLCQRDTMMTAVLKALQLKGCHWSTGSQGVADRWDDYDIPYLASVKVPAGVQGDGPGFQAKPEGGNLGEFSGEPGSGWMGTLNDWFTNFGFPEFSYQNGRLANGDIIHIQYTQYLGADIGGTWGSSDTSLKALQVSGGTIVPAFASGAASGGSYEYALVISGSGASIKVTPTAANKNYLVKTFLNQKVTDNTEGNSFYKRTESIPVRVGDTIYIGVGEYAWPSMNNQETENRSYTGTWYELHVISPNNGAGYVNVVIGRLPAAGKITNGNYESYRAPIGYIRTVYGVLNASEKAKVDLTKLTEAEAKLTFFDQIQNVKNLLAAIPKASTITKSNMKTIAAQVRAAETAYKALSDDQKLYITVGIVANYNAALAKLTELGAFDSGDSAPAPITGSAGPPEVITSTLAPKVTASNGVAAVSVSASDITAAIKDVKEKGSTSIVIAPEITGEASKVSVGIPKESLSSIASETEAGLTVQTPVGSLTIPNNVLTTIAAQAAGGTVTVSLASVDTTTLTPAQQQAVGDNPVYDINVLSGGANISSFAGGSITISLPYTLKEGEDPASVTVWYLNDAGELEQVACTYDPETGMAIFTTNHLTYYVVGYEEAAVPPAVPGQTFSDVSPTDWYYDSVTFVVYKGLMNGTSAATFSPNDPMTRAMLVTVLHRLEGSPTVTGTNSFSDVRDNEWYTEAVAWASAGGITTGYGNSLFGTNDSITRQQLATILYRYAEYKSYDVTKRTDLAAYTDAAEIGGWAVDALQWANAEKLLTGRTATTLAPGGSATRAEVAAILQRFVEGIVENAAD